MASRNKVELIGNLVAAPEVRYTPTGDAVATLRVATTDTWKDKSTGEPREATEYHRVVMYRKPAEIAKQYATKGRQVFIEGKLKTRKWQDKDGVDRFTTEIEVQDMSGFMLLGSNPNAGGKKPEGKPTDQSEGGEDLPRSPNPTEPENGDIPF